jgi:hypothetical protein
MKLWTIQPISWYEKLQVDGFIYGDATLANIYESMKYPYEWIINQMEQTISAKPNENATPIWAWYQYLGDKKKKPDLRGSCFLPTGTKGVRIEFHKNPNEVLLSDFDLWLHPLNYWCIHDNEKEDKDFDELLKRENVSFIDKEKYTPKLKKIVEKSWLKCLDLNYELEYTAKPKENKSIQATFWKLSIDEIVKVDFFTAR